MTQIALNSDFASQWGHKFSEKIESLTNDAAIIRSIFHILSQFKEIFRIKMYLSKEKKIENIHLS